MSTQKTQNRSEEFEWAKRQQEVLIFKQNALVAEKEAANRKIVEEIKYRIESLAKQGIQYFDSEWIITTPIIQLLRENYIELEELNGCYKYRFLLAETKK